MGSSKGSSIASWTLSKVIPIKSTVFKKTTEKILTKVVGKQIAKKTASKVVGRVLGRLFPGAGWLLLAYDATWGSKDIRLEGMKLEKVFLLIKPKTKDL